MRTHLRRTASAVAAPAAALLLLLPAPPAAGASAGTGDDRHPAPGAAAEEHADGRARFQAAGEHEAETAPEPGSAAAGERSQREAGDSGAAASRDRRPARTSEPSRDRSAGSGAASASNRGSVKVKAVGSESFPPSHEPHLPCTVEIHLYGFAAGTAGVRIDVHAPTGTGRIHTAEVALTEARGNQVSAVHGPIDLGPQLVGSYEPHPQQGYHLKLYVDRRESSGGAKQKVFWVDCGDEADAEGTTTGDSGGAGVAPAEAGRATGAGGAADVSSGEVLSSGAVLSSGEAAAAVGAGARAEAQRVGAEGPGGMLPRTGATLLTLALVGAAAVAAGAALLRARRADVPTS